MPTTLSLSSGSGGNTTPPIDAHAYGFRTSNGDDWRASEDGADIYFTAQSPPYMENGKVRIGHFGVLFGGNHFVGAPSSEAGSAPTFAWAQADRINALRVNLSDNVTSLCAERHLVAKVPVVNVPELVEAMKKTVNLPFVIPSGVQGEGGMLSMLAQKDFTNCVREFGESGLLLPLLPLSPPLAHSRTHSPLPPSSPYQTRQLTSLPAWWACRWRSRS